MQCLLLVCLFVFFLFKLQLVLFAVDLGFLIASPEGKMMEDDAGSHRHIETGSLLGVLGDVDKVIADLLVDWQHAGALIAEEESGAACKGMRIDGMAALPDFYSTNSYAPFGEILLEVLQRGVGLVVDVL